MFHRYNGPSSSMIVILLMLFIISLDYFCIIEHVGVESFSCTPLRLFTPRSYHPTRPYPLHSNSGDNIIEATKRYKKPPKFQNVFTSTSRGGPQQATGLVVTIGLIAALSFSPQLGNVIPPANAVPPTTAISTSNSRLPTMTSSSSLTLTSSTGSVTLPDSTVTAIIPSIAKSGMPRVASIMDLAGVLEAEEVSKLTQAMQQAQRTTQSELQIVIVNQVQKGYTPKHMATTLFNQWHLGTAQKNNGVLILVVLDERRAEINVGKALNKEMNAKWCQQILQETASPAFRQEQYGKGLLGTVQKVTDKLQQVDQNNSMSKKKKGFGGLPQLDPVTVLFAVGLVVFWPFYLYNVKYPIKVNCPSCNADKDTWAFSGEGWIVTQEATDQQEGIQELRGVCVNCGYVYTKVGKIRKYDGSTVDADGNTSYYYCNNDNDSSDSGGSSDGGGGGDSW